MRFYIVTYIRRDRTTRLGATSAAEAVRAIASMQNDGWVIVLIERGTEAIGVADLKGDAALEARRWPQGEA